jgi:hypothetical protein
MAIAASDAASGWVVTSLTMRSPDQNRSDLTQSATGLLRIP